MKNTVSTTFLIAMIICGFASIGGANLSVAQSSNQVSGIITSNTTWTKANSPYSLTGPFGIGIEVTLTIEAGTEINLNGFFIAVNGTLNARGTSNEKIHFNNVGGSYPYYGITFTEFSTPNSIIENALITSNYSSDYSIYINNTSTTINSNTISGTIATLKGSSTISNNQIMGRISAYGSPKIINNVITTDNYGIENRGESSTIISNNTIRGQGAGYGIGGGEGTISNNVISNFESGISKVEGTIERNLITSNYFGIDAEASGRIQNNTIMNNVEGIFIGAWSPTIIYNNMQNNTHNIYLNVYARINMSALDNWWGTADARAIKQTIHDNYEGFDHFTVVFEPYLISPNVQAPILPSAAPVSPSPASSQLSSPSASGPPITIPTSTLSPTVSSSQQPVRSISTELTIGIFVIILATVAILAFLLGKRAVTKSPKPT
jgi:hypothetical protein